MRMTQRIAGVALGLALISCTALAQLPASGGAPKVGEKAPDFTLPDTQGKPVKLSEALRAEGSPENGPALLLVFYRGYW